MLAYLWPGYVPSRSRPTAIIARGCTSAFDAKTSAMVRHLELTMPFNCEQRAQHEDGEKFGVFAKISVWPVNYANRLHASGMVKDSSISITFSLDTLQKTH